MIDLNRLFQGFKPKDAKITVSTCFDDKYLNYGKILLNSIQHNSSRVNVKVLTINIPKSKLQKYYDSENIEMIAENKKFNHPYEQRLYSVARRIFFVHELRHDSSVENLLQLDADLVVRKDLNKFGKLFNQGDFCIFARLNMRFEFLRLTMNILGLSNTLIAKQLTNEWVNQLWNLLDESQDSKYIDQLTLWKAYDKINSEQGVRLVNLGHPYIGREGNTIIRAFAATANAKGDAKLLKELNKYSDNILDDAPSNAPKPSEDGSVRLTREMLFEHFKKAGLS
ncbi:MAG: hypothetical protein AB4426_29390 [Xenococcaceae cyanobacterium]